MRYSSVADIVDGLEHARKWKFIRKGNNNWSFIGLDGAGNVVYEIEHLFYKQIQQICAEVKEDVEITSIEAPEKIINLAPWSNTLQSCVSALKGQDTMPRDQLIAAMEKFVETLT
jgi:hypothetical protein